MPSNNSTFSAKLALAGGAALALVSCNQTQKAQPPVQVKLDGSSLRTYKTCVYDALTKDPASGVSTQFSDAGDKGFVTTVMVDSEPVATITLNRAGSIAALDNTAELKAKGPLKPSQLDDAKTAAPGCFKKATAPTHG